ncbi:MAG TPA: SRPBCC domain-containing protein [Actinomycetes bacterium]|nr:SRPBCC domain-containing protein [Actinomycetes bacterium]
MEFKRNARIQAPLSDVWALVDDIPAVAGCIPGVHDLQMRGAREFDCVVSQRVGSVKSNFALRTVVGGVEPRERLSLESRGQDRALGSSVKANLQFSLADRGAETVVDIAADFQVTGRIATFGHRIISAKAEQVVMEAIRNVDKLLGERRATPAEG